MEQRPNETELLQQSRAGDKEAFGLLIERYQALVYALVYSATGSFERSEELAQETFLRAWQNLRRLRDATCFRGWLSTIARNVATRAGKKRSQDVLAHAASLEDVSVPAGEPGPAEAVVSRERQEMVWSALRRIPREYREPLVLFYSMGRSVREVAAQLDLSEHVVRQRLYRGRQRLAAEMQTLVEDTLVRVRPGQAFSAAVVALLPAVATPAAGAAVLSAKGVPAAKALWTAGISGAVLGPILGLLGGLLGTWASIHNTRSPRERRFVVRMALLTWLLLLALGGVPLTLTLTRVTPPWVCWMGMTIFFILLLPLIRWANARQEQIQIKDGTYDPPPDRPLPPSAGGTYGGFGGGIFGSLAWLLVLAGIAHDWPAFATVLAGATLTFLAATRLAHRRGRRVLAAWVGLIGVAALTFSVANLRWTVWMRAYRQSSWYDPRSDIPLVLLDITMVVTFAGLSLLFLFVFRWQRPDR